MKILRTLIPDPTPVPLSVPTSPTCGLHRSGGLIVRFGVGGRPGQWVTRGVTGRKVQQRVSMRAWQEKVMHAAGLAMREARTPIAHGPVEVWIDFVFKRGGQIPDRTNLAKSTEDAMQGIVYINDNQVIGGDCRRGIGPFEGAVIEVWYASALVIADRVADARTSFGAEMDGQTPCIGGGSG